MLKRIPPDANIIVFKVSIIFPLLLKLNSFRKRLVKLTQSAEHKTSAPVRLEDYSCLFPGLNNRGMRPRYLCPLLRTVCYLTLHTVLFFQDAFSCFCTLLVFSAFLFFLHDCFFIFCIHDLPFSSLLLSDLPVCTESSGESFSCHLCSVSLPEGKDVGSNIQVIMHAKQSLII